jgi:hypothetical protein
MQRARNMLIMQEYPDAAEVENEEEIQHLLLEAIPAVEAPAIIAHEAHAQNVQQPGEDEVNMMEISAAAYNGSTGKSTISLLIHVNGVPAIALAATGSTYSFLDKQFVMDHSINTTPMPAKRVRVAGGGILISDAIVYNHQFLIHGKAFQADFHVLNWEDLMQS